MILSRQSRRSLSRIGFAIRVNLPGLGSIVVAIVLFLAYSFMWPPDSMGQPPAGVPLEPASLEIRIAAIMQLLIAWGVSAYAWRDRRGVNRACAAISVVAATLVFVGFWTSSS